jgi:hypothetical protein
MCYSSWRRWTERYERREEERPITYVSDPEPREPVGPRAEEEREEVEREEKVPAGAPS